MPRLRVLISAYACSPYQGSEPAVGWGFVQELATCHDLWVVVEEVKFRADIERYLKEHPEFPTSVRFLFIRKRRNRWLRKIWPPSYYRYYRKWHEDAFVLARNLHAEVGFDIAHQLTMVGFREPGFLWKLGIPFVWGPVGGMGVFPWRFLRIIGFQSAIYYLGYNLVNIVQMRFLQRPQLAARAAGVGLITATPENQLGALRFWNCNSILLNEVGLPAANLSKEIRRRTPGEPLRIVWAGLLIPRKALNLGLSALNLLHGRQWELHILGNGPRIDAWKLLADQLGLLDRCHFHGWVGRDDALNIMSTAHVMLITSLRDLSSTVTIEALAAGLPIVCLDHCGFADVVDDSCGIKVPVTTPDETINGIACALERLGSNEDLRYQLATGALCRAERYSWSRKCKIVEALYGRVLGDRGIQ